MPDLYTPDQTARLLEQVDNLKSLHPAGPGAPDVPSGTVALFNDLSWDSKRVDLCINDYVANRRQRLPSSILDDADWVVWNLPIGTVVTFTDDVPYQPTNSASLAGALATFDLIGSGRTRSGSTAGHEMLNKAAAFWWREVDLWQGAVQFLTNRFDYGNIATLFLCEWQRDTIHSLEGWFAEDKISALNWKALTDRQTMTLYENRDGSGARYDNIKGWGSFKEIANLGEYGFEDRASTFSWTTVSPKKEIIDPITLSGLAATNAASVSADNKGDNITDLAQPALVRLKVEQGQTMTVETSDTNHVGMSLKISQTTKAGAEAIASSETTVEVGFTYDYTNTKTVTRTTSKTIAVDYEQTFNAPPRTHFVATVMASIGNCPPAQYNTYATRWYDYAVPNGVRDPQNSNWYKRREMVTFRIEGNLMTSIRWHMEATPL